MAQQRIYLRPGALPDAPLRWWREGDAAVHESGGADELAAACAGHEVIVLAPAATMVTLSTRMPAMPAQRLRQALPYALEEQIAGDVETMHFAHAPRDGDGNVAVVALEAALLEQWLALCEAAQLHPVAVYNEALCLPWQEGEWTLLVEHDRALLRTGRYSGYALDAQQWPSLLMLAWQGQEEPRVDALRVFDTRKGEGAALPDLSAEALKVEPCDSARELFCRGSEGEVLNLLQGPYSSKEQLGRLWAPWRTSAALLLALISVLLIQTLYDYVRLSRLDESLYNESITLFRKTFPEVKNIVNPRVQMERELAALQGVAMTSGFGRLLGWAGEAIAGDEGVALQGIRYRDGRLELALELVSLPQLDSLKTSLEKHPVAVEVRSASARGEKVEATILLEETGG